VKTLGISPVWALEKSENPFAAMEIPMADVSPELLACPWCRKQPTPSLHENGVKSYWEVCCADANHAARATSDFGGTEQQAIERWNTRALTHKPKEDRLVLEWREGAPPHPWDKEWFIALTTYGDRVVLRALPEDYTYDFKTADDTYIKRDKIAKWMQFPDSEYVAPAKPAVSEEARTFLEFWEQNPTGPVTVRAATRLRAAIAALTKEAPHAD
jgi:hypothetical protein